jgi:hypothetical protein
MDPGPGPSGPELQWQVPGHGSGCGKVDSEKSLLQAKVNHSGGVRADQRDEGCDSPCWEQGVQRELPRSHCGCLVEVRS